MLVFLFAYHPSFLALALALLLNRLGILNGSQVRRSVSCRCLLCRLSLCLCVVLSFFADTRCRGLLADLKRGKSVSAFLPVVPCFSLPLVSGLIADVSCREWLAGEAEREFFHLCRLPWCFLLPFLFK